MKYLILFIFSLTIIGCSNSNFESKSEVKRETTTSEKNELKVLKSGVFWNELDEGNFEIITNENDFLDTIDKAFGINKLSNGSYLYLEVSKYPNDEFTFKKDTIYGSIEKYVLLKDNSKTFIGNFTPDFDDYFSSPILIKDKLYFWGIESAKEKYVNNKIYASELNLISKTTIKEFLFEDGLGTDFRGYFPEPYIKNKNIIFKNKENRIFSFSNDFKRIN